MNIEELKQCCAKMVYVTMWTIAFALLLELFKSI